MKRIVIAGLAVILMLISVIGTGCSSADADTEEIDAIKEVFYEALEAYNQGDYEKVLEYGVHYGDEATKIAELENIKFFTGEVSFIDIEDISVDGSSATGVMHMTIMGQEDSGVLELEKVDGSWKIDMEYWMGTGGS